MLTHVINGAKPAIRRYSRHKGNMSFKPVMIHDQDVRCVGEISLMTALLRAGVVNEVITLERYVRKGVTR